MKTQILKWKDGKKAPFLLAFDDSAPTHLDIVVPELFKREMVGTFYIIAGGEPFQNRRAQWENVAQTPWVTLANHTFTHNGAASAAELEAELERANAAIRESTPHLPWPRLLSFGRPGGVPWTVSEAEVDELLTRFRLAARPPFRNPHQIEKSWLQTTRELLCVVDEALKAGQIRQIGFHGVGGDWLSTPLPCFLALLDELDARRAELWFTDAASAHKYQFERDAAQLEVAASSSQAISLQLRCGTDSTLYDLPLSLAIEVPENWVKCEVEQGSEKALVETKNGVLRYEAAPVSGEIALRRA